MTTLVQRYIDELVDVIGKTPGFPAAVETSTLRAFTREDYPVLVVHRGKEAISEQSPYHRYTRIRELLFTVHSAGFEREEEAEAVFDVLQPIVMSFSADGLILVEEVGTSEPMFAQGDRDRMAMTKRFIFTYQTEENSLSQ